MSQPTSPSNPDLAPPDASSEPGVGISPRVDLVFQRIFGAPGNEPLLLDLLNAVLRPARPIVAVRLLNPVLSPQLHHGRLVIVDLVAVDDRGAQVQVEMQTTGHAHLRPRILYGWAALYGRQLSKGESFAAIRPVISIWFCERDLLSPPPPARRLPYHARFHLAEVDGGEPFLDHLAIHVIELGRFRAAAAGQAPKPEDRWLHFLAEAEGWRAVPPLLHSAGLEAAMTVLSSIRADPEQRAIYEAYCKQESIRKTQEEALAEAEAARAALEEALEGERAEAEQQRAEAEQQRAALEEALLGERAEAEQQRAEAEQQRAEAEQQRAEAEQQRAEAEAARRRAEALAARLRALGIDPEALG